MIFLPISVFFESTPLEVLEEVPRVRKHALHLHHPKCVIDELEPLRIIAQLIVGLRRLVRGRLRLTGPARGWDDLGPARGWDDRGCLFGFACHGVQRLVKAE